MFSSTVPDLEIRRSKQPVALIVSAGYIKPKKVVERGNYFVVNDKKVRGIYAVNNKYSFMWGSTKVYWYAVQEANPIDPIMIDKLNGFMAVNRLVHLRYKDIKQGIRLRLLSLRRDKKAALDATEEEERSKLEILNESIDKGLETLAEEEEKVSKERETNYRLPEKRKAKILLDFLLERDIIDKAQHTIWYQAINKDELNFESLLDELKESHEMGIVEPLNEDIERFLRDLGKQNSQEWAGVTQDLRGTKRGLGEMVAKPVTPTLSLYLMIFASLATTFVKSIELHFSNAPIALTISGKQIRPKTIIRRGDYCIFNDESINGIYEMNEDCQYMWGKTLCQLYQLTNHKTEDPFITNEIRKYAKTRKLFTVKKEGKKVLFKPNSVRHYKRNSLLDYLVDTNKITQATHDEFMEKIRNKKMNVSEFIFKLKELKVLETNVPLNLDVEGFIHELGAQNAQEWAGHTQDLRNSKKLIADMTRVPVKSFLSGGIILAIGLVAIMAFAVVVTGGGSGLTKIIGTSVGGSGSHGGGGFSLIPNFGGHFILPLLHHIPNILGWLH